MDYDGFRDWKFKNMNKFVTLHSRTHATVENKDDC